MDTEQREPESSIDFPDYLTESSIPRTSVTPYTPGVTSNLGSRPPTADLDNSYSPSTYTPYGDNSSWEGKLRTAYRKAGVTNEDMLSYLIAQDALESGWGKHVVGDFNYGNIQGSYNGKSKSGTDHDANGKKYHATFRSYPSMDEYAVDKISLLSRLYDFN
jgi:hypothetical protein